MNSKLFTFVAIALLTFNLVHAQNAEKHINRLVGEIDQDWIKSTGETIPVYQMEYISRKVQGFNAKTSNARMQSVLNQSWFFFKNIDGEGVSKPEKVQIPHQFEKNRKLN